MFIKSEPLALTPAPGRTDEEELQDLMRELPYGEEQSMSGLS